MIDQLIETFEDELKKTEFSSIQERIFFTMSLRIFKELNEEIDKLRDFRDQYYESVVKKDVNGNEIEGE